MSSVAAAVPPAVREACRAVAETMLADEPRVRIFLFGSRASGRGKPRSDIDLGIDVGHPLAAEVMVSLREVFESLPVLEKVDLVDFAAVGPEFRELALKDTLILYERQAA
jgi:predicted nucleotidyltransferase